MDQRIHAGCALEQLFLLLLGMVDYWPFWGFLGGFYGAVLRRPLAVIGLLCIRCMERERGFTGWGVQDGD